MKAFTINTDSWHYRLAELGGYSSWSDNHDICAYMRANFTGLLFGTLISILGVVAVVAGCFLTVHAILGLVFGLMYGTGILSEWAMVGFCFYGVAGTMLLIQLLRKWYLSRKPSEPKEAGFVKQAYMSWKGKYCIRLNILDVSGEKIESFDDRTERYKKMCEEADAIYGKVATETEDDEPETEDDDLVEHLRLAVDEGRDADVQSILLQLTTLYSTHD